MTNVVSFQNPGLIPIEAITTLGVNVKENDNPIGFFGTGLKYAIAALLRTNQKITIWCGLDKYEFEAVTEKVRGKEFGFIWMTQPSSVMEGGTTKSRLGFTTHLGSTWEPWQIFRELYSNCLDEGGVMKLEALVPSASKTTIIVEGDSFHAAALRKREIFLESPPLYLSEGAYSVEVHADASDFIYYRGIRAGKLSKPSVFTYNILTQQELTEDRTLKDGYMTGYIIENLWENSSSTKFLGTAITNPDSFEWNLNYSAGGKDFCEIINSLIETLGITSVPSSAARRTEIFFDKETIYTTVGLTDGENLQLTEALEFLTLIGHEVTADVLIVKTLGPGVHGLARNGKIYISQPCFDKGGNWLAAALMEEQLHISHGFKDESRDFQNYLFDLVIKFAREARGIPEPKPIAPTELAAVAEDVPF